jgi:hypothetical protein
MIETFTRGPSLSSIGGSLPSENYVPHSAGFNDQEPHLNQDIPSTAEKDTVIASRVHDGDDLLVSGTPIASLDAEFSSFNQGIVISSFKGWDECCHQHLLLCH